MGTTNNFERNPSAETWVPAELPEGSLEWKSPFPEKSQSDVPDADRIAREDEDETNRVRGRLASLAEKTVAVVPSPPSLEDIRRQVIREEPVLPGVFGQFEKGFVGFFKNAVGKAARTSELALNLADITLDLAESPLKLKGLEFIYKLNGGDPALIDLIKSSAGPARRIRPPLVKMKRFLETLRDWITPDPDDTALAQ